MNFFCKNSIHATNIDTHKQHMKRDYKYRTRLDEDLCTDCLEKILSWKAENPTELKDEQFEEKRILLDSDMRNEVKKFILS